MLHSIQQRYGEKLRATDGEIGYVRDFYFDDKTWTIRYLVADTGGWLSDRQVLISPHALGHLYPRGKVLLVNLTREQIEKSPSIDAHKPISRQQEEEFHRHHGYPYYAESWPLWSLASYPVIAPPPPVAEGQREGTDAHLRSARFVKGYKVEATDGVVGELADYRMDGRTWVIRELVIECGHWYSGREIIIPTEKVSRISYEESTIYVRSPKSGMVERTETMLSIRPADRAL